MIADLKGADSTIRSLLTDLVTKAKAEPEVASHRGVLGMAYEVNGFADAALESYAQAERLDPLDPRWPYYRSLLLAHRGDLTGALEQLDRSLELDNAYAPAWLWRGTWLLDLDRTDEAANAFAKAAGHDDGIASTVGLARVALRDGEAEKALGLLEPEGALVEHPYVYKLIGQARALLGDTAAARDALARVTRPGTVGWLDERSDAKRSYEGSVGAQLQHARGLLNEGKAESALTIVAGLRSAHPDHQGLLNVLSEAYRRSGRAQEALDVLTHATKVHPEYYSFRLNLADLLVQQGEQARALEELDRALALNPNVGWAHAQRGLLLVERGELDGALAAFRASIEREPQNASVYYYAGMVEASRRRWASAAEFLGQAVEVMPEFTLAHVALANTFTELARWDEARAALDRAARIGSHPGDVNAARVMLARREAEAR